MKKYILFDLDGTLTRSEDGILNAVGYALKKMGITESDRVGLLKFIGPPLRESFSERYGLSDADTESAIKYYREYYSEKGLFECEVYDGIPETLKQLKDEDGHTLAVATSKPQTYSARILEHFCLTEYFDVIVGSELNGERDKKADVIRFALKTLGADAGDALMIGDRRFDVLGAHENGVRCIGVTYGYGSAEELREAGADYIANSAADIRAIISKM